MGCFGGAELCQLIDIYIESILAKITSKNDMGLCRDDGLILLKNKNGQHTDKIGNKIVKIFKYTNFSIDIITNLVEVNFLDVTFIVFKSPGFTGRLTDLGLSWISPEFFQITQKTTLCKRI